MYTARRSEIMYPLAIEYADSGVPATYASAWINVGMYHRVWLVVNVGDMVATATLDAQIRQAADAAGGTAAVIVDKSGLLTKAITQLTQAGGDSDSIVCIELQTEELTLGREYVQYSIVVGVAAVEFSAILYGCEPRFMATAVANWTEIID